VAAVVAVEVAALAAAVGDGGEGTAGVASGDGAADSWAWAAAPELDGVVAAVPPLPASASGPVGACVVDDAGAVGVHVDGG